MQTIDGGGRLGAWIAFLVVLGLGSRFSLAAVIDNFSVTQSGSTEVLIGSAVGVPDTLDETGLPVADVLTTTRSTTVLADALVIPGLDSIVATIAPAPAVLDYASSSGAEGMLRLVYDVPLGGAFLDLSGDQFLQIDLLQFDPGENGVVPVTATLYDGVITETLTRTLVTPGAQSLIFEFDDFARGSSVNLAQIQRIEFEFDATDGFGTDFRVDMISSDIPEPGSLVLLVFGSALLIRRRQA